MNADFIVYVTISSCAMLYVWLEDIKKKYTGVKKQRKMLHLFVILLLSIKTFDSSSYSHRSKEYSE